MVLSQFSLLIPFTLQGSVAITGAAVKWLRDNLNLFNKASEIGIYFFNSSASGFLLWLRVLKHDANSTFHLCGSLSRIQGCHVGPGPGIPQASMSMT